MRECYDEFGQNILRLTQWDLNRVVTIQDFEYEETPIVHFAHINDEKSLVVTGDDVILVDGELKVKVPNELLLTSESILMNIFVYNRETNKGINVDNILLPVQAKPQPNDYVYVDNVNVVELSTLKLSLQNAITNAQRDVNAAIISLEQQYQTAQQSLTTQLNTAKTELENQVANALRDTLDSLKDGTPKETFKTKEDLLGKESGIYLCHTSEDTTDPYDGYVFYWDGEKLSDPLILYNAIKIGNGQITYEMLSETLVEHLQKVIDYNDLLNQPIKNLALSMTENTMLTDIADGCYIIAEGGYIQTTGGSLRALGAGTELIVFTYNDVKSATYQSGKALASFDDNMTASDKLFTWLNTSDKDLQITESATDDTIPTSKAVKEYVDNNTITDYNNLLNQPIKNLDLDANDINNPISLSAIGEGVFIVTSNGYIITKGGYKKVYGKGTELVIVLTSKSGVPTLCMTVQDGSNFYRVDDDISSTSEIRAWLSSNNKTSVIDEDNASKVPTAEAVMNYVTEVVNNSIADALGGSY